MSVTVFQHVDYEGKSCVFNTDCKKLSDLGWNDKISSMKVTDGYECIAFQHVNYGGEKKIFTGDVRRLSKFGWNDKISSLQIVKQKPVIVPEPEPEPEPEKIIRISLSNNPGSVKFTGVINPLDISHWSIQKIVNPGKFDLKNVEIFLKFKNAESFNSLKGRDLKFPTIIKTKEKFRSLYKENINDLEDDIKLLRGLVTKDKLQQILKKEYSLLCINNIAAGGSKSMSVVIPGELLLNLMTLNCRLEAVGTFAGKTTIPLEIFWECVFY